MSRDKQNIKTTDWLIRGIPEEQLKREKREAIKEAEAELRDKQIEEMRYLADEMGKAISTEIKYQYIKDERKLEEVLKANGWCKASDLAEEIFAEIGKSIADLEYRANTPRKTVKVEELKEQVNWVLHEVVPKTLAELKKKYTEEGK